MSAKLCKQHGVFDGDLCPQCDHSDLDDPGVETRRSPDKEWPIPRLEMLRKQAEDKESRAAQQAYINGLEFELRGALEAYDALESAPRSAIGEQSDYLRLRHLIQNRIANMRTGGNCEPLFLDAAAGVAQSELADVLASFDAGEGSMPSTERDSDGPGITGESLLADLRAVIPVREPGGAKAICTLAADRIEALEAELRVTTGQRDWAFKQVRALPNAVVEPTEEMIEAAIKAGPIKDNEISRITIRRMWQAMAALSHGKQQP